MSHDPDWRAKLAAKEAERKGKGKGKEKEKGKGKEKEKARAPSPPAASQTTSNKATATMAQAAPQLLSPSSSSNAAVAKALTPDEELAEEMAAAEAELAMYKAQGPKKSPAGKKSPAAAAEAQAKPKMEYGAAHGNRHFGGNATKKKSKWTLDKGPALALMEAEIAKHMETLVARSSPTGWTTWYISGTTKKPVGKKNIDNEQEAVREFTLQVQVNLEEGVISYHGYPDINVTDGASYSKSSLGKDEPEVDDDDDE